MLSSTGLSTCSTSSTDGSPTNVACVPPNRIREILAFANTSGRLADIDPDGRPLGRRSKRELKSGLKAAAAEIADLQEKLFAEAQAGGRRRLLLVLQGTDTAGKGGVTRHVFGGCEPIGVQYTAFKKPTEQELEHDFLWRIRARVPPPGFLGIFDRSQYEDVLVPRVHRTISPAELDSRYHAINDFERELADGGTTIVKVLLHISSQTQRDRLIRRLDRPDKHWKFDDGDVDERAMWPEYQDAFQAMLERCDTAYAPWYVVPGDSKKYRNWAVGELIREAMRDMNPHYPPVQLDVERLKARLLAA
jgi:PPK2 family polyphosphate:nucleotide phosphotransferase